MKEILDAIQSPDSRPADFSALPIPESYRAVTVHKDEVDMFAGLETREKDPRKSLHIEEAVDLCTVGQSWPSARALRIVRMTSSSGASVRATVRISFPFSLRNQRNT